MIKPVRVNWNYTQCMYFREHWCAIAGATKQELKPQMPKLGQSLLAF